MVSAARIPLAIAFPIAIRRARRDRIEVALGIVLAAAATDVLDGLIARYRDEATPTGALVDGIADKIFGASVLGTLVVGRMLAPSLAMVLAARELGELALAARLLVHPSEALAATVDRRANGLGKVATTAEFAAVVAVLLNVPWRTLLVGVAATFGAAAAISYWRRESPR